MSQSAVEPQGSGEDYFRGWKALYEMLHSGRSLSGRERNCCYLNLGDEGFADVSAISGLDLADDGRGIAVVDWDFDGRLDLWVANRTGPRLRFLHNRVPGDAHFASFRLRGTACNRDAIGARIELELGGNHPRTLVRSLRAGGSYLSQSSKWVHFGLGAAPTIEKACVQWPDGSIEELGELAVDRYFTVAQGEGRAREWSPPEKSLALFPSPVESPPPTQRARVPLAVRLPLPPLAYEREDGSPGQVQELARGPVLVALWASWCSNCVSELGALASRRAELQATGVTVLALSLDIPEERGAARDRLESLGWPFQAGYANEEQIDLINILHRTVLDQHHDLVLPTSLLIDAKGRLAAIYKGPLEVDVLLTDLEMLPRNAAAVLRSAVPYPGRWLVPPAGPMLNRLVTKLSQHGFAELGAALLGQVHMGKGGQAERRRADVHLDLAQGLILEKRYARAIEELDHVLRVKPSALRVYNLKGFCLRELRRFDEAIVQYREALRRNPVGLRSMRDLAFTYLAKGDHAAAEQGFRDVLNVDPDDVQAHLNLGLLLARSEAREEAVKHLRRASVLNPENLVAHRNLALLLHRAGELREAAAAYEKVLVARSDDLQVRLKLGLLRVDLGDGVAARQQLQHLREAGSPHAQTLEEHLRARGL